MSKVYAKVTEPFARNHKNVIVVGNPDAPEPHARAMVFDSEDERDMRFLGEIEEEGGLKRCSKKTYLSIATSDDDDDDDDDDEGSEEKHLSRMTTAELTDKAKELMNEDDFVDFGKLSNNDERRKSVKAAIEAADKAAAKAAKTGAGEKDGGGNITPKDPDAAPTS